MANHNAKGKTAKYAPEIASRTRYAILKALEVLEEKSGKSIGELVAEEHEGNVSKLIELASKLVPKETNVSGHITQTHEVISSSEARDRLNDLIGQREDAGTEGATTH